MQKKTYWLQVSDIKLNPPYLILYLATTQISIKFLSTYWINNKACSIIFDTKSAWKEFIVRLFNLYNTRFTLFFYKLRLKGLGFRIHRLGGGLFRFFFNQTNYFYFSSPIHVLTMSKKRVLFFVSDRWDMLRTMIVHLLLLKKLTMYRTRGLLYPSQIRILKPGKKRF
jgi:hypothetical protein